MQTIDRAAIGSRLRELRGNKPQSEVASATGVTTMAISQYERGERIPNDEMKVKIAAYYNKSVEELFFTC